MRAKFEVSSSNRSGDMVGIPTFEKVGHVNPSRLINKKVTDDPIFE